jgi:hypothetical protein
MTHISKHTHAYAVNFQEFFERLILWYSWLVHERQWDTKNEASPPTGRWPIIHTSTEAYRRKCRHHTYTRTGLQESSAPSIQLWYVIMLLLRSQAIQLC